MDHLKILKRSWEIMWRYRALWIFGIILALATAGGSGGGSGNNGVRFNGSDNQSSMQPFEEYDPGPVEDLQDFFLEMEHFFNAVVPDKLGQTLLALLIGFICVMVLLAIVTQILGYISRTAMYRMVDEYEETEHRRSVGEGFRLGWSRTSWRLFLIDLVIGVPAFLGSILLLALASSPLLLWLTDSNALGILGTVAAIGMIFIVVLILIVVGTSLTVLMRFMHRACALEDMGVFDAIRHGYRIVRANLKDTALMWLILLGLQIVYGIAMLIVGLVLVVIALLVGGAIVLLIGGVGALLGSGATMWIVGGVIGGLVLMIVVGIPALFLNGLKEVYINNAWTLSYREMYVLDGAVRDEPGALEPEVLEPEVQEPPSEDEAEIDE